MLLCVILWAITLAGLASGNLDFDYYPQITRIPSGVFAVICYTAYGALSFLPFILEAEEMIRWKFYRSKI
jgi:hypothetical protein